MGDKTVPPFVSLIRNQDVGKLIFMLDENDRTLAMLNVLMRSSKIVRTDANLNEMLGKFKRMEVTKTSVRDAIQQHLEKPLSDDSALHAFIASELGSETCRFHLMLAIRKHCVGGRACNRENQTDLKIAEANVCIPDIIRVNDCVLLLDELHKFKFSPRNSLYLFDCVETVWGYSMRSDFQYVQAENRAAAQKHMVAFQDKFGRICHDLTEVGVYAAMFTVCIHNARDRSLLDRFMDIMCGMPGNVLISVFKTPQNLVKLQTLVYGINHQVSDEGGFTTTYRKYGTLIKGIFENVESGDLILTDLVQFEVSKLMIRNLEEMNRMTDREYCQCNVQEAICRFMSLDTTEKLYRAGYIERLAETTDATAQPYFHDLVARWNAQPGNPNQWTWDQSALPAYVFVGLSP